MSQKSASQDGSVPQRGSANPSKTHDKPHSVFTRFASHCAQITGRPISFFLALAIIVVWGITGPIFAYSDTWQLVINTGTTIVTFLMVFLIQNSQNRDTAAIQIKLDELIRTIKGASNALLDLEQMEEQELEEYRHRYARLAQAARDNGGDSDDETEVERDS